MAAAVSAQLNQLVSTNPSPRASQLTDVLLSADAAASAIEVSVDKTPTGLPVDAIEAAAKVGTDCVIAHVSAGKSTVTVLPALKTGTCFVGNGGRGTAG